MKEVRVEPDAAKGDRPASSAKDDDKDKKPRPQPTGPRPQNWLCFSVASCLCLNIFFGIAAFVLSLKSNQAWREGDEAKAKWRGKCALKLNIAGVVVTILLLVGAFFAMMALIFTHPCVWA